MEGDPGQGNSIEKMTAALEHVGPYYGELFATAARIFPQFKFIAETTIITNSQSSMIFRGLNREGKPIIQLGTEGPLPQRVRSRLIKRLELPDQAKDAPDSLFMRFIFPHEMGHVLQADPEFEKVFGNIDQKTYIPEEDYEAYVHSDKEVNADFIAAMILGNSEFGKALGISPPNVPPKEWRTWAKEHPLE